MFLPSSRYAQVPQVEVETPDGRTVNAVTIRRLPSPAAAPLLVRQNDRLDLIARRALGDGTAYWRIADANTELEARRLEETGRTIDAPER